MMQHMHKLHLWIIIANQTSQTENNLSFQTIFVFQAGLTIKNQASHTKLLFFRALNFCV